MEQETHAALKHEVEKAETLGGLRRALDLQYQRLCQLARADWERLIGPDPADACVTVRVQTGSGNATRGSGFLKSRRQATSKIAAKGSTPRFAH